MIRYLMIQQFSIKIMITVTVSMSMTITRHHRKTRTTKVSTSSAMKNPNEMSTLNRITKQKPIVSFVYVVLPNEIKNQNQVGTHRVPKTHDFDK